MMNEKSVEITNPLWRKIAMSVSAWCLIVLALMCWLSPFVPNPLIFWGQQIEVWAAALYGAPFFIIGVGWWWQVMHCKLRADTEGITQNHGFRCQSVRWEEVAAYYMEPNERYASRQPFNEPILLHASGEVLLRASAYHFGMSPAVNAQRRELWQFVEAQLEGKKCDAPFVDFDPHVLIERSSEAEWKTKSVKWKIARCFSIIFYTAFWFAVFWSPIFYLVSHGVKLPKFIATVLPPLMTLSPLLPWVIRFERKKRKIAREWATRDKTES